jgi:hypothetical protein
MAQLFPGLRKLVLLQRNNTFQERNGLAFFPGQALPPNAVFADNVLYCLLTFCSVTKAFIYTVALATIS